jgi:acyl-CoA synthetase (AMP-forming)/AMP-acid ligase II
VGQEAEVLLESPTMWGLVEARVAETPDAVMVVDDRRQVTFAEFRAEAERAAAGLQALGVHEGVTVAWQLPTWIETIVLMAALARLGARQVPLLPIYKERELRFCLEQSEATFMLHPGTWRGNDFTATVRNSGALDAGSLQLVECPHELPEGDPATLPPPPAAADGEKLRWIFYTSGTTADPKGVQHCDRSVMAGGYVQGDRQGFRPGDRYGLAFPFTHIGGATNLAAVLICGFTLVLAEAFEPDATTAFYRRNDVTVTGGGTAFYLAFIDQQRKHGEEKIFPHLRFMSGGAAPMPPHLHPEVREVLGGKGVAHCYGMTEGCTIGMNDPDDTDDHLMHTVGRPVSRVEVRVRDLDGNDLPPDTEGQVTIRGPLMFAGYLDESLNADVFDDEGWFSTGDLGILDADGYLKIVGRIKDIIIRKGENVSAAEVEGVLAAHPAIADVGIIGVPDDERGEMVCAVVALEPGATLTLDDVVAHCVDAGMMRQKIPERLELIDTLPRNTAGKIEKRVLRAKFAE